MHMDSHNKRWQTAQYHCYYCCRCCRRWWQESQHYTHTIQSNPFVHQNNFVKNFLFRSRSVFSGAHASLIYDYGFLYSFSISESECQDLEEKLFRPFTGQNVSSATGKIAKIYSFSTEICVLRCFSLCLFIWALICLLCCELFAIACWRCENIIWQLSGTKTWN